MSWDNYFEGSGNVDVWYSNTNVDLPMGVGLLGNLRSNPFFCYIYNEDYTVAANSPVIGAGQDGLNMGNVTVGCDSVNIGPVWYISTTGSDTTGDGSPDTPFETIQRTIDMYALENDTIILNNGVYTENIIISNKSLTVGSLYVIDKDESHIISTIIDGQSIDRVFEIELFNTNELTRIEGLSITNGFTSGSGGGIYIYNGSIQISNCIINNCHGAIYATGMDSIRIEYCNISNNQLTGQAGGLSIENSFAVIDYCTFVNNSSQGWNDVDIYFDGPSTVAEIKNSIIWNYKSTTELLYNAGIGIDLVINYSDIGNLSRLVGVEISGVGNIELEPMFVDTSQADFHLLWNSPCIDTGDPNSPLDPDGTRTDMGAFFFDQRDLTPPTVSLIEPSSETSFGTEDKTIITWQAEDNWVLTWAKLYYRSDPDSNFQYIDSLDAEIGSYEWEIPDSVVSSDFQVSITVSDYKNNTTSDTSGTFSIYDNTPPDVLVTSPSTGFSIPEYHEITVIWSVTDNIEMDSVKTYYSNNGGESFSFKGSIAVDSIELSFNIPQGMTDEALIKVVGIDIYGNEGEGLSQFFSVTDYSSPTTELLLPTTDTQLEIGSTTQITWTADDNVEVTSIDLRFSTDNCETWSDIVTNEDNDGEYYWLVPDNPSNQVGIQLIAYDAVGLSDTSEVMGLSIVIAYPKVVEILPTEGLLTWRDKQIVLTFSQPIDPNSITSDNIMFSSNYSPQPALDYIGETQTLIIDSPSSFASLDTLIITLQATGVTNIYGYQLDGNGDGTGGDDLSLEYTTTMLADYDTSDIIDVIDLAQFVQGWEGKDYFYELGPVSGSAPHLISSLDYTYNIEDIMGFVMMWNWYVTSVGGKFRQFADVGNASEITTTHDSIFLEIPNGALAFEVQIQYDPTSLVVQNPSFNSDILLTDIDEEAGVFSLLSSQLDKDNISLPISIKGRSTDVSISFRSIGQDGVILNQMSKQIHISNIPAEYALHQNYPNPFNPYTTILYDLAADSRVTLMIYDLLGRQIQTLVNEDKVAGYYSVLWDGKDRIGVPVGTGVYFYRINALGVDSESYSKTYKMVFLK